MQDFFDKLMIDGDLRLERFKALAKVHGIPAGWLHGTTCQKEGGECTSWTTNAYYATLFFWQCQFMEAPCTFSFVDVGSGKSKVTNIDRHEVLPCKFNIDRGHIKMTSWDFLCAFCQVVKDPNFGFLKSWLDLFACNFPTSRELQALWVDDLYKV